MRTLLIAVVLTTCATAQLNAQGWAMHQQEIDDQNANFKTHVLASAEMEEALDSSPGRPIHGETIREATEIL